jgi:predicted ATPase
LGARAFDVLMMLVEHRHRILSKDELLAQVWPGVVVEENNLATQISNLRKVLGPGAITTIPGRGYQFTAEVVEVDDEGAVPNGPDAAARPSGLAVGPRLPQTGATTDGTSEATKVEGGAARAAGGAADLAPPEPLVGRADTLADLLRTLSAQAGCVTLLGAGGIGKTALARWVAQAWRTPPAPAAPRPVVWLDLMPLRDADGLAQALAQAVAPGAAPLAGAASSRSADWAPWLARLLHTPDALWVLDNAEHLREPVARLVTALQRSLPDLRLLLTSQVPLGCPGERRFPLGPLALPSPDAELATARQAGALALFEQAAQQANARFALDAGTLPLATQLVQALGGVPLALKLAAARLPLLGLPGLVAALDQRLRLLAAPARPTGDDAGPDNARHRTLKATLDWSHSLLPPAEQRLFRRLAVCRGEFSLPLAQLLAQPDDAAEDAGADTPQDPVLDADAMEALAGLVDRSLVELVRGDGLPSYRLPETHRLYALVQLDAHGERELAQRRHALAVRRLMAVADTSYWSEPDERWLARQELELDNLRAALDWSGQHDPALAMDLLGLSSFVFLQAGLAGEARRRGQALEGQLGSAVAPATTARFLLAGSRLLWGLDGVRMLALALQARQAAQAAQLPRLDYLALRCAMGSGALAADEVPAALAEMVRLEDGRWPARLRAQRLLAAVDPLALAGDDRPQTLAALREAREALRAVVEPAGLATLTMLAHLGLAESDWLAGQPEAALARCARLLADARLVGNQRLQVLACQAAAQLSRGDADGARASLQAWARLGAQRDWEWFDRHADLFAWLAALSGQADAAPAAARYADAAMARAGGRRGPAQQRAYTLRQAALAGLPDERTAGANALWLDSPAAICTQLGLLPPLP